VPERPPGRKGVLNGPLPPDDIQRNSVCSLLVHDGHFRHAAKRDRNTLLSDDVRNSESVTIWNDEEWAELRRVPSHEYSRATRSQAPWISDDTMIRLPMIAMWPLDNALGNVPIQQYRVTGTNAEIEGHICAQLYRDDGTSVLNELWLDPAREFLIVQANSRDGDKLFSQFTFQYEQDPDHGWIPVKWRWTHLARSSGEIPGAWKPRYQRLFSTLYVGRLIFEWNSRP